MAGYLDGSGDISQAHSCTGCHAWVPNDANFCGRCGRPQRPLPAPPTVALQVIEQRYHRRRRRALAWGLGPLAQVILRAQEHSEKERVRQDMDQQGRR